MQILLLKVYYELTEEHTEEIPKPRLQKPNLWETLISSNFAFTIFRFFVFFLYLLCLFLTFRDSFIVTAIGVFSSCVEAILPLPQFYNNWRSKSVESLRLVYQSDHDFIVGFGRCHPAFVSNSTKTAFPVYFRNFAGYFCGNYDFGSILRLPEKRTAD